MTPQKDLGLKDRIEKSIMSFEPRVCLDLETSSKEVSEVIRVFMRSHPEIFWFSNQYSYVEATGILILKFNFTKNKSEFFIKEIDKVITSEFNIHYVNRLSELEKLVYIYKWIAKRTSYNEYSSFNQTIYSILINRNSVCTGYAKTAQYLLGICGMESKLVFGKFHSDKSDNGRHAWNIVKVDGKWYHVDFCLADKSLVHLLNDNEAPIERDSILWNYFGVSNDKIIGNREIEYASALPTCCDSILRIPDVELWQSKEQMLCCKSDSGSFAKIYLNPCNKDNVFKISRNSRFDLLQHEARILSSLKDCTHVVKMVSFSNNILELEQLTPWSELLNSHYYKLSDNSLRMILCQLTEGLIECRDLGVQYQDIHYNNIFVSSKGVYKWGDFGNALSEPCNGKIRLETKNIDGDFCGSIWFIAPETYRDGVFNEASAVYSLAMLAYFVMNDMRPPFWSSKELIGRSISRRFAGERVPPPRNVGQYRNLWNIINRCLDFSAANRPQNLDEFLFRLFTSNLNGTRVNDIVDKVDSSDEFPYNNNSDMHDTDFFAATDYFASTAAFPGCSAPREMPDHLQAPSGVNRPIIHKNKGERKESGRGLKSMFKTIGSLFGKSSAKDVVANDLNDKAGCFDDVNVCLYAPAQIQANRTFLIRVYFYMPEETDIVDSKVKSIDPNARKKEYKPLDIPVKRGDTLEVRLEMSDGVSLNETSKKVTWSNHFVDCSFMARLNDNSFKDVFGTAFISMNGVPAGELLFTIDVAECEGKSILADVGTRKYSHIFISYSHADEGQVKSFAECCSLLGNDYFFDRHTLKPGDVFKDKILEYIDNADLFVLFWSKNAAESEWVGLEREHALSIIRDGNSKLRLHAYSLKPEAPLPDDMIDTYHFGIL